MYVFLGTTLCTRWDIQILDGQLEYISRHVESRTARSNGVLIVCFKYNSEINNLLILAG